MSENTNPEVYEPPQVPTESTKRVIRALPTRRAGEIERQKKMSQQSQQSSRGVELRSLEHDEQLHLRIRQKKSQPDSRAGLPQAMARSLENDCGRSDSLDSNSDADSEFGETNLFQEVSQNQWHPARERPTQDGRHRWLSR